MNMYQQHNQDELQLTRVSSVNETLRIRHLLLQLWHQLTSLLSNTTASSLPPGKRATSRLNYVCPPFWHRRLVSFPRKCQTGFPFVAKKICNAIPSITFNGINVQTVPVSTHYIKDLYPHMALTDTHTKNMIVSPMKLDRHSFKSDGTQKSATVIQL